MTETTRIGRQATDGGAGLRFRLARERELPVGKYVDSKGCQRWVRYSTAAALVRRGHATWKLGSDGKRWIEITPAGKAIYDNLPGYTDWTGSR